MVRKGNVRQSVLMQARNEVSIYKKGLLESQASQEPYAPREHDGMAWKVWCRQQRVQQPRSSYQMMCRNNRWRVQDWF